MQKRSERSSSRKPPAVATAAAAAVDSDGPPRREEREHLAELNDAGGAAEQNEIAGVDRSDDGEITDGDAEEGEWDDGFEESSDEGVGALEGEEQQDADQTVAALR